jgi:hypothetical protein
LKESKEQPLKKMPKEKKVSKRERSPKLKNEEISLIPELVPLLSFSPVASVENLRFLSPSQNDSIILSQKWTHLSDLIAKNVGENYISKLEMIKISKIISGYILLHLLDSK